MGKKSEYQQKAVVFGGKKLILFSLDGVTWSSRKDELQAIKARHEQEKITINDIRGVADDAGAEKDKEEAGADDKAQEVLPQEDDEVEIPAAKKGKSLKLVSEEDLDSEKSEVEDESPPVRRTRAGSAVKLARPEKAPARRGRPVNSPVKKGRPAVALPKKRNSSAPLKKSPQAKARRRVAA